MQSVLGDVAQSLVYANLRLMTQSATHTVRFGATVLTRVEVLSFGLGAFY